MPKFGLASREALATCHPDLQRLFNEVIKHWDCKVLEGHRGKAAQNAAYAAGASQLKWPFGNHNKKPSTAVDVVPYPVDWDDIEGFVAFAFFVQGVAAALGIKIRWGGDWNKDRRYTDERFRDFPHFELT